ncbi:MAG: sugar phosphate isomerase/epimerase family protein [Thermosulfidibacteraceae bacterium]|jgi:sugar phosphate isomerase/epimerase
MKLLLSIGTIYGEKLGLMAYVASLAGFDGVEVVLNDIYFLKDIFDILEGLDSLCPIMAFHAPFNVHSYSEKIASILRSIEIAKTFGVDVLVVHPPLRLLDYRYRKWFRNEFEYKNVSLNICVELMPFVNFIFFKGSLYDLANFKELVRFTHEKNLKIAFDTTHCGTRGIPLIEGFEMLGGIDRIGHVHLSDFAIVNGQFKEHLFPGEGNLDLGSFLRYLKSVGYKGKVTLEVLPCYFPKDHGKLVEKLVGFVKFVKEL